jgi:hypothetical protein
MYYHNVMEEKDLEAVLKRYPGSSKDIEVLLKRYPYVYKILKNPNRVSGVYVKPLTSDIREGTGYLYDSGYNYFSSTQKLNEIYVEYFDTWGDESDKSTQIKFYIPEMQNVKQ